MFRYHYALFKVFSALLIIAITFLGYRYFVEVENIHHKGIKNLNAEVKSIEIKLAQTAKIVKKIQSYAHLSLKIPTEFDTKQLLNSLKQDGNLFTSRLSRNDVREELNAYISGVGNINLLGQSLYDEINMANTLIPLFKNLAASHANLYQLHYLSVNQFLTVYPYYPHDSLQYHDSLLEMSFARDIKKNTHQLNGLSWQTFQSRENAADKLIRIGAGIYHQDILMGIVFVDIKLEGIAEVFDDTFSSENKGNILLFDDENILLLTKGEIKSKEALEQEISLEDIKYLSGAERLNDYSVIQKKLIQNNWKILKVEPYSDFVSVAYERFKQDAWLFLALLMVTFIAIYWLSFNAFIKPLKAFLDQMLKGPQKKIITLNESNKSHWRHYLKAIVDIHLENEKRYDELEYKQQTLSLEIEEKTKLYKSISDKHEQDHVLLRSGMNAIPDYLIFNDLQGGIIGCNPAFESLIGKSEADIIGKTAGSLLNNELGASLLNLPRHYQAIASESGYQEIVETVNKTYEIFCTHFFDDLDVVIGTVVFIRDVTEQYATQADMQQAKEQAEYANQAKSQFLANMSHEIRTPINAIKGMINLLDKSELSRAQQLHLNNANSASNSLLHLIDELLDLAKIESGNMNLNKHLCELNEIVGQAIKLNINTVNKNQLNLVIDIASDVPNQIITDEMRLVQVLTNLINNAVKFTHAGEIKLQIETTALGSNNALIRFRVVDNGIGIDKDKQGRLFEAFKQADDSMTRKYGGSGLGLSICQQIVNLMEGEIICQSEKGVGTEFSFVLPFRYENQAPVTLINTTEINLFEYNLSPLPSFISSIEKRGWNYKSLDELSEISSGSTNTSKNILILPSQQLNSIQVEELQTISLLAVCHPMGFEYHKTHEHILSTLKIPYILLESPIYRHHINQIEKAIEESLSQPQDNIVNTEALKETSLEGVKVLLVEDNLVNQLVAKELLKTMKAEVFIAENGEVAIKMLDENEIDVVLMDIQMPVMDGLTATKLIREKSKFSSLPIIAMTAHARQEDKDASLKAGMNLHIAKPIQRQLLLDSILSVLPKQ